MKHICLLCLLFCFACKTVRNLSPELKNRLQKHQSLAVLPPHISLSSYKDEIDSNYQKKRDGFILQQKMINSITKTYKYQEKLKINVQKSEQTQTLLIREGIRFKDTLSTTEAIALIQLLKVDAIIFTKGYANSVNTGSVVGNYLIKIILSMITGNTRYNQKNLDTDMAKLHICIYDKDGKVWQTNFEYRGAASGQRNIFNMVSISLGEILPYYQR